MNPNLAPNMSSPAASVQMAEQLGKHPFTRGMPRPLIEKMADFAMEVEFSPDECIFREGDPANRFYLIVDGEVALESYVEGRGAVRLQRLGPGDVLGWSWMFPPYYWHFDAQALKPTRAIMLYGTPLRERCEEDPVLGYELLKRMAALVVSRLQMTRRMLLECQRANGAAV